MAKIHHHDHMPSNAPPDCLLDDENKEIYTVWMKSLVLNSNGCTIYDSSGNLVSRVDNYDTKRCTQVNLMDLHGKVLCTLLRKKLKIHEHWNGYKCEGVKKERPWFRVKKISKVFNKGARLSCQVTVQGEEFQAISCFRIQGSTGKKSEFQIIRGDNGVVVAQVKRKQISKGVMLGDDVLSLEVGPQMDRAFIMALVVVHALMSHKL